MGNLTFQVALLLKGRNKDWKNKKDEQKFFNLSGSTPTGNLQHIEKQANMRNMSGTNTSS